MKGGSEARRGSVPAWLPLGLVAIGIGSLVIHLGKEASARGVAKIDLRRYAWHSEGQWVSPAWRTRLETLLVDAHTVGADDRERIDELVAEIADLSFVKSVGEPEVRWPDGLVVPIDLRQPVACLRVGEDFLPVAPDGVILAGYAYSPHRAFGGYLPVLGPHGLDADPTFPFEPGDRLLHPGHVAGLAVAASLFEHLDKEALRRLGRVVIDASQTHAFDGKPGGVFLDLEGARRIHLGRSPIDPPPGELPLVSKWHHVDEALREWESGAEFAALDARWDEADRLFAPGSER